MWIVQAGDRGFPIINEREYINEDIDPNIKKINVHRYISGRLVVEILCGNNRTSSEMSNILMSLAKKIQLNHLNNQVSFERITCNQESTDELRRLLDTLASKYWIPQDVINDINIYITKMSASYSPSFYEQGKVTAKTEAKNANNSIKLPCKDHLNDIYVSIKGDGFKSLEEGQRVEAVVLNHTIRK